MFHVQAGQELTVSKPVQESKLFLKMEESASLIFADCVTAQDVVVECQEGASLTFKKATHFGSAYVTCARRCVVFNMKVLDKMIVSGDESCTMLIHIRRTTDVHIEGTIQLHMRSLQAVMWEPKTWFHNTCVFCINNEATRVAMPCRHSTWCQDCEESILGTKFQHKCSICMGPVTSLYVQ